MKKALLIVFALLVVCGLSSVSFHVAEMAFAFHPLAGSAITIILIVSAIFAIVHVKDIG